MIILTKSFKKQLKFTKIKINDVVKGIDRVINKKIFRKGDTLLSNSYISLKNCVLVKMRIGQRQQARMLVVFIIVNNIKIPFFIANKNNKKYGANVFFKSALKKIIKEKANSALEDFNNKKYNEINE